jgi:alpha-2-macroglobulin
MREELKNIQAEFRKIRNELGERLRGLLSTLLSFFKNLFIRLHPKNLWSKIKSLRWEDIKKFPSRSWTWLVDHYPVSTKGWLACTFVFLCLLAFVVSLLPVTPAPPRPVKATLPTPELQKMAEEAEPPDPEEGLHVLAHAPGGEVSPEIDGIKILFDHSMIPMTDVDPDRHPKIPLAIDPPVPGEFVWFGTQGFLYRFSQKLPLATTFHVRIPRGLQALDGKSLEEDFHFQFSTPPPEIVEMTPLSHQDYVPLTTPVRVTFSQPMKHESVEKGFQCKTWKKDANPKLLQKEDCPFEFQFAWEKDPQGREVLAAQPKAPGGAPGPYPTESTFEITLPPGLKPESGDRGTTIALSQDFSTAGRMDLEKIWIEHPYPTVENEDETVLFDVSHRSPESKEGEGGEIFYPTGDLCFRFTNPVDNKSFETALQLVPLGNSKPDPTFRIGYYYEDEVTATEEEKEKSETPADLPHLTACLSADLKYNTGYEVRFLKPVTDRAGQPMQMKAFEKPLRLQTRHASLEGKLNITKMMLNAKTPPSLPFTSLNSEKMELRIIYCGNTAKSVKEDASTCVSNYDEKLHANEQENASAVEEGNEKAASTPPKDPALRVIPIPGEYDIYYQGRADLAKLYPDLKPGVYAVEAKFHPMSEITIKKKFKTLGIEQEKLVEAEPVTSTERILLTGTALAYKKFENQVLVWAVDIATGEPRAQLPIQIWSGEALLVSGWTDSEGLFKFFSNGLPETEDLLVVADDPKAFGSVRSEDTEGITPESFGLEEASPRFVKNYFTFLQTDRPLYRPSQTVFFSGFLRGVRDGVYQLPRELNSVKVTITDPEGTAIYDKDLSLSAMGLFTGQWTLGDDAIPRGRYRIEAQVPTLNWKGEESTQNFVKVFYVASYKKPDFKVDLKPERSEYVSGETVRLNARGSYFFGAPLSKAEIEWSVRQEGFRFQPIDPQQSEKYRDYLFVDEEEIQKILKRVQEGERLQYDEEEAYEGDHEEVVAGVLSTDSDSRLEDPKIKVDRPTEANKTKIKAQVLPARKAGLGEDGLFQIEITPDLQNLPTSQIYTATLTAKEWGQEVSAVADVKIHKSYAYVGLKSDRQVVAKGQKMNIDVVSVDYQAKPIPDQAVKLQLFKRDYMTIKKRTAEGAWVFESEPKDTQVKEALVKTDGEGHAVFSETAAEGGTYRIVATTEDNQGHLATAAVHVGVGGEADAAWKMKTEDQVALSADKPRYKVGETAQILIPFPTTGMRGLLTVERAGILKHEILRFEPNQNTVSVPITEEDVPNVYVSLLLFRPQGLEPAGAGPPALMKMGLIQIPVEPERKQLRIALKPEKEVYAPKEKVRLKVKTTDASGNGVPADLILSAADESVLRLIDYQSPDLLKRFYFPRKLGVVTAENMIHYKSGDAGDQDAVEKKKRSKFLDTAFFSAPVHTDASGEGAVEFTLPDNLTTWVVEAFGITEDTKVGSTFLPLRSTLPTFLRPVLPRFLAVEDEVSPVVFVENPSTERFEGSLGIQATGGGALTTAAEQKVAVDAGGRVPLSFGLKGTGEGKVGLKFVARNTQQSPVDVLETSLPVYDRSLPVIFSAGGATREVAVEQFSLPPGVRTDRGELEISVGTLPLKIFREALAYLFSYPYGCAEQRTSALLGLWQLGETLKSLEASGVKQLPAPLQKVYAEHYKLDEKEAEAAQIKKTIEEGLSGLYTFQQGDGGFVFWNEDPHGDPFLSADMARAFYLLGTGGVAVDAEVKQKLVKYLTELLDRQRPLPLPERGRKYALQSEADGRAFIAWNLALLDPSSAVPSVKSLLELKNAFGPRGLSSLALAIRALGGAVDPEAAWDLIDRLEKQAQVTQSTQGNLASWKDSVGVWDEATTTAVALEAVLMRHPDAPLTESAVRFLISRAKRGNFGNTLATRESLLALWRYASLPRREKGTVTVDVVINGRKKTQEMALNSPTALFEDVMTVDQIAKEKSPFVLQVSKPPKSPGALYYQASLSSYFPMASVPRREEGLIIAREFYALDDLKEEKPLKNFKLGESYKATLTVLVPERVSQLTVEHLLPSGFEPVDFDLATADPDLQNALLASKDSDLKSPLLTPPEFGHEEIHDDKVMWSASRVSPGIYKFRHVVRAATAGKFQAPGATAFPFYNGRYFGRSRSDVITIETSEKTVEN